MYIYIRVCGRVICCPCFWLSLALCMCADDIEWCRVKEHRPSVGRISSASAVCIHARVFCELRLPPQEGNKKLRLSQLADQKLWIVYTPHAGTHNLGDVKDAAHCENKMAKERFRRAIKVLLFSMEIWHMLVRPSQVELWLCPRSCGRFQCLFTPEEELCKIL